MYGLVYVKKEYFGRFFFSVNEPFICQIDEPPTVDKHKQFHWLIFFGVLNSLLKLSVIVYGVNLIMDAFTFEKFLINYEKLQ